MENCKEVCYFNPNCHFIKTTKSITLQANSISIVETFLSSSLPNNCILQVKHHIFNKCWRILNDYLFEDPISKNILIPLISQTNCMIHTNEILGHVQIVTLSEAMEQRIGLDEIFLSDVDEDNEEQLEDEYSENNEEMHELNPEENELHNSDFTNFFKEITITDNNVTNKTNENGNEIENENEYSENEKK